MSSTQTLEERVEKLEQAFAQLMVPKLKEPGRDDWRKVVGMFPADDPVMKQIDEEGRKIREADRERARQDIVDDIQ